jgi:hypothetical protein
MKAMSASRVPATLGWETKGARKKNPAVPFECAPSEIRDLGRPPATGSMGVCRSPTQEAASVRAPMINPRAIARTKSTRFEEAEVSRTGKREGRRLMGSYTRWRETVLHITNMIAIGY